MLTSRGRPRPGPRPPNWQLRAQQLERELAAERQAHSTTAGELAAAAAARAAAHERVMVLERTVAGQAEQLLGARRELVSYMRGHGLGELVRADPDA